MRKLAPIVAVFLCISFGVFNLARRRQQSSPEVPAPGLDAEPAPVSRIVEPALPLPRSPDFHRAPAAAAPVLTLPEPTGRAHVFRLQLDRGNCTLEKMEEVRGVFRRERTPLWQAGMLYCRLVASDGRVVGERTIPAPDHVCFVLDPNVSTEAPVVARLTPDAPVLFQVRFDGIAEAVRLDVHRISTDTRPADSATPIGPLLGSIAIPGK